MSPVIPVARAATRSPALVRWSRSCRSRFIASTVTGRLILALVGEQELGGVRGERLPGKGDGRPDRERARARAVVRRLHAVLRVLAFALGGEAPGQSGAGAGL